MGDIENILGEYGTGDVQKRLCLYLEHRSLRRDFMEIDRSELQRRCKKKAGVFGFSEKFGALFSNTLQEN